MVVTNSMTIEEQVIHCKVMCKVNSMSFHVSFVYGYYIVIFKRPLWESLRSWRDTPSIP